MKFLFVIVYGPLLVALLIEMCFGKLIGLSVWLVRVYLLNGIVQLTGGLVWYIWLDVDWLCGWLLFWVLLCRLLCLVGLLAMRLDWCYFIWCLLDFVCLFGLNLWWVLCFNDVRIFGFVCVYVVCCAYLFVFNCFVCFWLLDCFAWLLVLDFVGLGWMFWVCFFVVLICWVLVFVV